MRNRARTEVQPWAWLWGDESDRGEGKLLRPGGVLSVRSRLRLGLERQLGVGSDLGLGLCLSTRPGQRLGPGQHTCCTCAIHESTSGTSQGAGPAPVRGLG